MDKDIQTTFRLLAICLIFWGAWKTIPEAIAKSSIEVATLTVLAWCLMLTVALFPAVLKLISKL